MASATLGDLHDQVVKGVNLKTKNLATLVVFVNNCVDDISDVEVSLFSKQHNGIIKDMTEYLETRNMKQVTNRFDDDKWRVDLKSVKITKITPSSLKQKSKGYYIVIDITTSEGYQLSITSNTFQIVSHQSRLKKSIRRTITKGKRKRTSTAALDALKKRSIELDEREQALNKKEEEIEHRERNVTQREKSLMQNELHPWQLYDGI